MKLLITGDWHLDAVTAGVARLTDVETTFNEVVRRVRSESIDVVVFLGDLTNPDKGTRTLRAVTAGVRILKYLIRESGCAVVAIAGNHDVVLDSTGLTSLTVIREAFGTNRIGEPGGQMVEYFDVTPGMVAVVENPAVLKLHSENSHAWLVGLPFVSPACQYDPEKFIRLVGDCRPVGNLVVAGHLQLEGAILGSESTDMPRGRDVAFPINAAKALDPILMCNGHYHKRQTVRGVECPGSLARLAFGEEKNEPQWIEVEV